MIIAINFADQNFEKQRQYNTRTAYSKGKVDKVIEYSPKDIDANFAKENANILAYKRGAGLWLWKPYFILKTLQLMNDGDYLFYCDSGAYYINKVKHLITALERSMQPIMGFELPMLERQFTKGETFHNMSYKNRDNNQLLGSYLLLKKSEESIDFVKEWLNFSSNEENISPKIFSNIPNSDDFIIHREDQSILSILYHQSKYVPFREPTQFSKRVWEHKWIPAYTTWSKPWIFNSKEYKNSPYPQILVHIRSQNPYKARIKEFIKNFMFKIGLYDEKQHSKIHKID